MLTDPRLDRAGEPPEGDDGPDAPAERSPARIAWERSRLSKLSLETWFAVAVALLAAVWVWSQLHPGLLLADTTPAGGDMGAHVWGPAWLRDHLIPSGRLTGWTPDWYAGFAAYHFYMVIPSLAIVALDVFLPYGVAFKLVTVSGLVSLPLCAVAMGKLAGLRPPIPALFSVATLPFLFDRAFTIYGGNVASTLAGEFAFSISLSLTLLYFGVLARGLRTGEHRALAAVLLALVGLCHLIPAFFAIVGTIALLAVHLAAKGRLARMRYVVTMAVVSGLLGAFWALPFALRSPYMTDMGWEKLPTPGSQLGFWDYLLRGRSLSGSETFFAEVADGVGFRWVLVPALVGAGFAIGRRSKFPVALVLMAAACALGFWLLPQTRLWNARLLPFWYLCLYLLAAVGIGESLRVLARLVAVESRARVPIQVALVVVCVLGLWLFPRYGPLWSVGLALVAVVAIGDLARSVAGRALVDPARDLAFWRSSGVAVTMAVVVVVLGLDLHTLPFGDLRADGSYRWLSFESGTENFVRDWAEWNYKGYERKPAYPEYHDVVQTMDQLGREDGCGRAMWEYEKEHDRYGTPMALMLLPFWTDGCVGSMEGLYFESSATTPYHFLSAAALSARPSNPQRDLPYTGLDFGLGVRQLQLMGVKWYLAISDRAKADAHARDELEYVTSSGPWEIFEVADAPLVQPLRNEPVVVEGVAKGGEAWQDLGVRFFQDPTAWDVFLAADGPEEWRRIDEGDAAPERRVPPVEVSGVEEDDDRISFDVDRPGSPVLVKASYFPNWEADGAEGPWRVTPNLMVVIPTSEHVELRYGQTGIDLGAWFVTLLGLAGVVVLAARGRVRFAGR